MTETVSVIDLKARKLERNIPAGKYPVFSLSHPYKRDRLLVTLHNMHKKDDPFLVLVNTANGKVARKIPYPPSAVPSGMVWDERRGRLYVADESLDCIHVHDAKTLKVLSSLPAGSCTVHVDISSDGKYLAATNRNSGDLTLYNLEKEPAGGEDGIAISLKENSSCEPYHLQFSRDPGLCYVTDFGTGELVVIDVIAPAVMERIRVGNQCFGMALDETGSSAYVCTWDRASVALVDLDRKRVVEEYRGFGGVANHCAVDTRGHQLVVTCQGGDAGGAVRIMDLETKKIVTTITDEKIQAPIGVTLGG